MKHTVKENEPGYADYIQQHANCPIPSEFSRLNEKLDAFGELLALPNSLFRVLHQYEEKLNMNNGDRLVRYDLLIISQLVLNKIEEEFLIMRESIEQGGNDE